MGGQESVNVGSFQNSFCRLATAKVSIRPLLCARGRNKSILSHPFLISWTRAPFLCPAACFNLVLSVHSALGGYIPPPSPAPLVYFVARDTSAVE